MTSEPTLRETQFYEDLAWRLKIAIEELPHPKREVANTIGVSQQRLSNWITNQNKPDWFSVAKLCSRYGISADWVLLGEMRSLPKWLADRLEQVAGERLAGGALRACVGPDGDLALKASPEVRTRRPSKGLHKRKA